MDARRAIIAFTLALLLAACSTTAQPAARPTAPPAPGTPSGLLTAQAVGLPPTYTPTVTAMSMVAPTTAPRPTAMPAPTRPPSPTAAMVAAATVQVTRPASSTRTYVFPVRSKGKITYGRFHHDYPATDIFCPVGSEFVAVTDGVVDFVSREDRWDPQVNDGATRGGLAVAIIGDDGVRYYGSHLSQVADRIEPGVRVTAGHRLGLTGKSGDARTTDPHLHFGISHPTTPDDWKVRRGEIGPYDYLLAWQRGENVTPRLP
jgi:murein DD-endopeptidase MepM/ murein hydrolase activator NlpD